MKRLTEAEALLRVQPPKLTKEEWHTLWRASLEAEHHAQNRTKIYHWALGKGEV